MTAPRLLISPTNGLTIQMTAKVVRYKRSFCPACGQRRILYRIEVAAQGALPSYGDAMCTGCAGLRPE